MNWKRYQNELILAVALLFALTAFVYKNHIYESVVLKNQQTAQELVVLQETAGLKKIWTDKRISSRLDALRSMVPPSKVQWHKSGKKLTATFTQLQPSELNRMVSKLLNLPVQIDRIHIVKKGETYEVELKCKW